MQKMQNVSQKFTHWLKVVSLGLVLGLGLQFAQAWVAPTDAPPAGNVAGPITTGPNDQVKDGGLGITTNLVVGGSAQISSLANCASLGTDAMGNIICGGGGSPALSVLNPGDTVLTNTWSGTRNGFGQFTEARKTFTVPQTGTYHLTGSMTTPATYAFIVPYSKIMQGGVEVASQNLFRGECCVGSTCITWRGCGSFSDNSGGFVLEQGISYEVNLTYNCRGYPVDYGYCGEGAGNPITLTQTLIYDGS